MEVVKQIYKLRQNFILIGLTGRIGSGCSTVAKVLGTENVQDLKSNYRDFNEGTLTTIPERIESFMNISKRTGITSQQ